VGYRSRRAFLSLTLIIVATWTLALARIVEPASRACWALASAAVLSGVLATLCLRTVSLDIHRFERLVVIDQVMFLRRDRRTLALSELRFVGLAYDAVLPELGVTVARIGVKLSSGEFIEIARVVGAVDGAQAAEHVARDLRVRVRQVAA
jgi:hypothetical protein